MGRGIPSVVAVAGRRIDPWNATTVRFPPSAADRVQNAIADFLAANAALAVVASAASGADILALEAAVRGGLRTRIVLPYVRERFRETSVRDGGEEWVARFDKVLDRADDAGDVVKLRLANDDAYTVAAQAIVRETQELARAAAARPIALVVWDRTFRPGADATRDFVEVAQATGMEVFSIPILGQ